MNSILIDEAAREEERLAAVHSLDLLDKAPSQAFDDITRLATFCFNVPTALISLVDRDRQQFISRCGLDLKETPRSLSVCSHAIRQNDIFEVPDLLADDRFRDFPSTPGKPQPRFYAGVPLIVESGHAIGTLCIIDYQPRTLNEIEREQLQAMARVALNQIELRQTVGRRDAVSGLPNRQQFISDIRGMSDFEPGEKRLLVLIEVFEAARVLEMAQALGMAPIESLLRQVGVLLHQRMESSSKVYHVAMTRFAFLLRGDALDQHEAFLAELSHAMNQTISAAGIPVRPMVRMGLVPLDNAEETIKDGLRKAIFAVNAAVEQGLLWTYYDAERDAAVKRSYRLATDIQRALANNEFYLVYQPRIDLAQRKVVSVEALLRWSHPVLGMISPLEFIPIIERTALMQTVTIWVINEALRQIVRWKPLCPDLRVSVNLSPRDFDNGRLVRALEEACLQHGVDPAQLELEVTEGEGLRGISSVQKQLADIRAIGADVAIDDFGSGYSNFAYLKHLPANIIKVDQSLIRDLPDNVRNQTIVRAILDLSRSLGYRTVAEGVECKTTLGILHNWGCEEIQGYWISKPIPTEEVAPFLEKFLKRSGEYMDMQTASSVIYGQFLRYSM